MRQLEHFLTIDQSRKFWEVARAKGTTTDTQEEYYLRGLRSYRYGARLGVSPAESPPGFWRSLSGLLSTAGMYSSNETFARQSIVASVQNERAAQRRNLSVAEQYRQIDEEYRYCLAVGDEHFHGEERRQATEADERRRMRMFAEEMADALARRAAR